VEVVLAIRASFHSSSVCRWLFAALCFSPKDSYRCCAVVLRSATIRSPQRSAANIPSVTTGRDKRGRRAGLPRRINWNWRRNFSHAGSAFLSVGSHSTSRRCVGAVHLGELHRRVGWLLHKSPHHPFAGIRPRNGSNYRRNHWVATGEQALCRPRNFNLSRDSPTHCGNQTDLHEVDPRSDGFPAGTYRRSPRPSVLVFDREG